MEMEKERADKKPGTRQDSNHEFLLKSRALDHCASTTAHRNREKFFLQLEQKPAEGSGAASGSPEAQPVHA